MGLLPRAVGEDEQDSDEIFMQICIYNTTRKGTENCLGDHGGCAYNGWVNPRVRGGHHWEEKTNNKEKDSWGYIWPDREKWILSFEGRW